MDLSFLAAKSSVVAPQLLGYVLERTIGDAVLRAKIVEVEAYDQTDAASHSYRSRTPRTEVMFGSAGYLYVYFTYGMHYCMNIVTGAIGEGSAVLVRGLEPIEGQTIMAQNRRGKSGVELTNGPAKACQAMDINMSWNGHDLTGAPLRLIKGKSIDPAQIVQTTRVGISQAKDVPWRFYISDNPFVSRPN